MNSLVAFALLFAVSAGLVHSTADPAKLSAAGSQAPPAAACVKLVRSEPFPPDESPMPKYPDPAKEAHVEGDVTFHLTVVSGCATDEIGMDDGPQMLREAVENSVKNWKYCGVPEGQEIHATIAFRLNCSAK